MDPHLIEKRPRSKWPDRQVEGCGIRCELIRMLLVMNVHSWVPQVTTYSILQLLLQLYSSTRTVVVVSYNIIMPDPVA